MVRQRLFSNKWLLLLLIGAVLVAGGSILFLIRGRSHPAPEQIKTIDKTSIVGPTDKNGAAGNSANQISSDKSSSAGVQTGTSGDLASPSGGFVSNHRPGQNGSNLMEASQCTTTPGAKCYIKFTQNDVVKTLPVKVVDADRSVFWEWDVKEAGLTKGSWTITAIATLGDQTKSTKDQLVLEVQ